MLTIRQVCIGLVAACATDTCKGKHGKTQQDCCVLDSFKTHECHMKTFLHFCHSCIPFTFTSIHAICHLQTSQWINKIVLEQDDCSNQDLASESPTQASACKKLFPCFMVLRLYMFWKTFPDSSRLPASTRFHHKILPQNGSMNGSPCNPKPS